MILVDSNIPIYLVGGAHPNKEAAQRLIERAVAMRERLVTDAEVFQEVLHRYVAIRRREAIQPAFDALLGIVDDVFAVQLTDIQRARRLVLGPGELSARGALHVAIMHRQEVDQIMSFDRGFDAIPGVSRLRP